MHIDRFKTEIIRQLIAAEQLGLQAIQIKAGEIHNEVEGATGSNRIPICCSAMYALKGAADRLISAPPKGKGSSLTIEYALPRPARFAG